eukprot:CAMPEP_0185820122 /NCGR_PEP_ID=MMETSP1322-20130828/23210_1 /TAXON_ID=265543 /ORGANISM="Minutocellus polymorphus, Strain RCC2270" /LENGTH=58 /DNA_ID=CAMNT_0028517395 /DNA_START=59 /DNA_END=232 /DNA_ORIENTATION=+
MSATDAIIDADTDTVFDDDRLGMGGDDDTIGMGDDDDVTGMGDFDKDILLDMESGNSQ